VKIAVTGTRDGMTIAQWEQLEDFMHPEFILGVGNEFHCGDCVGADTQAYGSVQRWVMSGLLRIQTHGWPGKVDPKWKAHNEYDVVHEVLPPMVRNRRMVDLADFVLAGPKEYDEVKIGSGTWGTIRHAQRTGKRLTIVYPDASVQHFNA
jgi:hypothetical protein